ncbi:two-component response regulator ARR5 [Lactuca sativa]|uniref:two-component response regulator ARR5 n=1 Tax=Lactuca sativa TaxID=4236 RepID=UPI000CC6A78E|nr:two-component response regulator ARR5 [Lactuca sativa]
MKKLRAVVVDDQRVQLMYASRMLRTSSFEVIAAVESGEAALEFLGLTGENDVKVDVDLILTDHDMTGISGYELLLELKKSELSNVPVVILSADANEERMKKCMDGGALMFLEKPLQAKDVANVYNAIVE